MITEGMWGSYYYNKTSKEFACGDKDWSARKGVGAVTFQEVVKGKAQEVGVIPSVNTNTTPQKPKDDMSEQRYESIKKRLTELKALLENGLINKEQYENKRSEILESI